MAKRHHASHRRHPMKHEMGYSHHSAGSIHHTSDEFNDEFHHSKRGEPARFSHDPIMQSDRFSNEEMRRKMEMLNGGMIQEDRRAIANMPQEVMIKPYPRTGPYLPEGIDDTIRGVDHQMDYDDSQRARHFYPKKV